MNGRARPWNNPARWLGRHHGDATMTPSRRATRPSTSAKRPKILFVNQYYWPDTASTAQHLADLAEALAERGFEPHVVCSKGSYKPGKPPLPSHEVHRGVHIHRVGATSLGRRSTLRRMVDYLSFYANAAVRCATLPRFDAVVTLTTPPIIGLVGNILKGLKGSRHVYWSMDLHPDASIALGRMSPKNPAVAALDALSRLAYRRADLVVALGPYMVDRIRNKGVRPNRIVEIPVWSRREEIYPIAREGHELRASLGLAGKFVAMYSGNLGLAHTFGEFLGAARRLRDREDIVFLFVGDGPRMAEVREAKEAEGLANIRFLDYFPREQLHASLSVADVHLISMRTEMTGIVVPGKLYGAMASGRPVLFVGPDHSESADTVRESDVGLTIREGDIDGLVRAIELLASDDELRQSLGERARAAFLDGFERDGCVASWADRLEQLLDQSPSGDRGPGIPLGEPLDAPARRPKRRLVASPRKSTRP